MLCGLGQLYKLFAIFQALFQKSKVVFARLDEYRGLLQLRKATCGLHVGDLEVVAKMTVGVLVVVALRQITQLPAKALTASVVFAWHAIAVTPPVAEALRNGFELVIVSENRAALTHGDMVCRIETQGCDVAKGANHLTAIGGAQGIAAILYQP